MNTPDEILWGSRSGSLLNIKHRGDLALPPSFFEYPSVTLFRRLADPEIAGQQFLGSSREKEMGSVPPVTITKKHGAEFGRFQAFPTKDWQGLVGYPASCTTSKQNKICITTH